DMRTDQHALTHVAPRPFPTRRSSDLGTGAAVPGIIRQIPALAVLVITDPHMPVLTHKFVIFNLKSGIRPAALWSRQEWTCFPAHNATTSDSERADRFNVLSAVPVRLPTSDGIRRLFTRRLTSWLGWCVCRWLF